MPEVARPPIRIPLSVPCLEGNAGAYVARALQDGWVSSVGPVVANFEAEMARWTGARHAVATMNGTAALHASLLAAGVTAGDRVAVSSLTFIATVNPIAYSGAEPLFVDCDPTTACASVACLDRALEAAAAEGRPAKAAVLTHLYGHPLDIAAASECCARRGVVLIEDAAESLGASVGGRATGTWGRLGCLSFNGNKTLTTGAGGMVLTDDDGLARRVRYLCTQARDHDLEYVHDEVGFNYRMDSLSAALGLAQLEMLPEFLRRKRANAMRYLERLAGLKAARVVPEPPGTESSWWLMSLLLAPEVAAAAKPAVIAGLARRGIESRPFFRPAHMQKAFRRAGVVLPAAEALYARGLNLPNHPGLGPREVDEVCDAVRESLAPWS